MSLPQDVATPGRGRAPDARAAGDRRPRVTYLITSSSVAGAQRQVHDLAVAMAGLGWGVDAISMLPLDEQFADFGDHGIRTASLGMSQGIPDPRALLRLRAILADWRPDVLHGHMVHANLLARLSRLTVRTPVVISTMHNQNEGSQWRYYAYRVTDRLNELTTTVSVDAVSEAIRRHAVAADRIKLVPNGIETGPYARDAQRRQETRLSLEARDDFLWLALGRLTEAKDYPNMIAAFERALAERPEARILVGGEGPLEDELRSTVHSRGLAERFEFLGMRSDVIELLAAADGFLMSSAWEGLPMVLLEAAASELPIVATDVGGSRDVVLDGTTGFLVPPGEATALAGAMVQVMSMAPAERAAMGVAARSTVAEKFEMTTVAGLWDETYRGLLARA